MQVLVVVVVTDTLGHSVGACLCFLHHQLHRKAISYHRCEVSMRCMDVVSAAAAFGAFFSYDNATGLRVEGVIPAA